jgi:tetratricopeptide (TPR) repeat protein
LQLKKSLFQFLISVLGAILLASCAAVPVQSPPPLPPLIVQGEKQLEQKQYALALESFEQFLKQKEASAYEQSVRFDSALALEGLANWQEAADRYRSVARATGLAAPQLQAQALYRLSYCLEVLGDDAEVIAVLTDLRSRAQNLPTEVAEAEVPARMGASYARLGEFQQADIFYKSAEQAIHKYAAGTIPEWLPPTLYEMGHISERKVSTETLETDLAKNEIPIERAQIYLLQATELGQEPWASRAANEIIQIYQNLGEAVAVRAMPDSGDTVPAQRRLQEQQWTRAQSVLDILAELNSYRLPKDISENAQLEKIFTFTSALETKLHAILSEPKVGQGLTLEAAERQMKRRKGH